VSGSDFVEMFVGVGAAGFVTCSTRQSATRRASCFIDEIDAVAAREAQASAEATMSESKPLTSCFRDGRIRSQFWGNSVGSNQQARHSRLCAAQAGRFDRHIVVDVPDQKGREEILKVHARSKPLDKDVDLKTIAMRTPRVHRSGSREPSEWKGLFFQQGITRKKSETKRSPSH